MIKLKLSLKIAALALATISSIIPFHPAKASTFDETEVEQTQFIAVAQPFGENKYNLIVIEQILQKQACWSETGGNPVSVDLLLINFDFTGHCRRSTDANGYSIRFNGQDLGLDYLLSIVERNGELQLIGTNRKNSRQPQIVVGTTQGMMGDAMKIQLNPGWRFSKRTYQGKVLGHVYFSYSDTQAAIDGSVINETTAVPTNSGSGESLESVQEIIVPNTSAGEEATN
jgi:hypothetical protein